MGVYEVSVEGRFTARHAVRLGDGDFEAPHEHDWTVVATFRSERLDPVMGVVVDFLTVQEALRAVTRGMEATNLNALTDAADTGASAERVAEYLARALMGRLGGERSGLYRLAVSEAAGCWAAWYPNRP
jgi:6-pyruvoyl-tetrahydropterin synthase